MRRFFKWMIGGLTLSAMLYATGPQVVDAQDRGGRGRGGAPSAGSRSGGGPSMGRGMQSRGPSGRGPGAGATLQRGGGPSGGRPSFGAPSSRGIPGRGIPSGGRAVVQPRAGAGPGASNLTPPGMRSGTPGGVGRGTFDRGPSRSAPNLGQDNRFTRPPINRPPQGNPAQIPGLGERRSVNRPSYDLPGAAGRPLPGGAVRPSPGFRPGIDRPDRPPIGGGRPDMGDRPSRPGIDRPDRPPMGGGRPGIGDRPSRPGIDRPDRPPIGGGRPDIGDRPSRPGIDRPGRPPISGRPDFGDRPGVDRPDRDRPGGPPNWNRPGGDRPGAGRPDWNRPGGRPPVADWDRNREMRDWWRDRVGRGGGPPVIDGRRGNWDKNRGQDWNWWRWQHVSGPRWGWNGHRNDNWAWYWKERYLPRNYWWYRNSWHGGWANNWYIPLLTGLTIGSWQNNYGIWGYGNTWGYGPTYYNPYYASVIWDTAPVYDYSQPIMLSPIDVAADAPEPGLTAAERQAQRLVDQGVTEFQAEQYAAALAYFDQALGLTPGDPVLHEVRAMTLFALGRYEQAAVALNSLLAVAPGMDWESAVQLYGGNSKADVYTAQLRALEAFVRSNPDNAAARFVLAYQRLVTGYPEHAAKQLQEVVRLEPGDRVAQQMLAAIDPQSAPVEAETLPSPEPNRDDSTTDAAATPDDVSEMVDLIGMWRAEDPEGTIIELAVAENSDFTWVATPAEQEAVRVTGKLSVTSDTLMLESADQGTMVGQVLPISADSFRFALVGAPPSDPGLLFTRVQ